MKIVRCLMATPIVLIALYVCNLSNANSNNPSASRTTEMTTTQITVSNMTNSRCNPYLTCPLRD
ncbi:hypothetical protein [Alkalinema sp. FACHB-956]|uniref:hypothetical protein n=1 Tax=Alkalinema sp. FACHB-956 TaxID=2692768 RepID=UPI001688EFE7|nr:hypothetical protein [Alkalinema sp. FACHB-956]MBD2325781.1 hypothetical protein [Alkalinema sp. FACHB-956]